MNDIPRHWRPLRQIARTDFHDYRPEVLKEAMDHYGITEAEARKMMDEEHERANFWINDLYQVQATESADQSGVTHLNIRRLDGSMFKDWRHFQQIKNEICGPEREGLEIYPAESRKVDATNKWHLWVLPLGTRIPLGWNTRDVQYNEHRNVPGMRQRAL